MIVDRLGQFDVFNPVRAEFLRKVAATTLPSSSPDKRSAVVVVTHLLPDRPVFIDTLSQHLEIQHVFGIPYSTNKRVAAWISERFPLSQPSLPELESGRGIYEALAASTASKTILLEIGGYCATSLGAARASLGARFCGVVEGTESGLAQYRAIEPVDFPIICMSLSPIKAAESTMVGTASLFSTYGMLRLLGFTNEPRNACVLGFGRVGRSVAAACRAFGLNVSVYDVDLQRRLDALASGFQVPERVEALKTADIVFGATGQRSWNDNDAATMQDGVFLVSCSSRDAEFEFAALSANHPTVAMSDFAHCVSFGGKAINFLHQGAPANFRDGANAGPILTLLQAEMLASCGDLLQAGLPSGVQAPGIVARERLVREWFDFYVDPGSGWYKRRSPKPEFK